MNSKAIKPETRIISNCAPGLKKTITPTDIDWFFWRNMKAVKKHEACALALNINPDLLKINPHSWMSGTGELFFLKNSFPCNDVADKFEKLMRLLKSNLYDKQHFTRYHPGDDVPLSEFAAWLKNIGFDDVPDELRKLAKDAPQAGTEGNEKESKEKINNQRNEIAKEWLSTKKDDIEAMTKKEILEELKLFSPDNVRLFIAGGDEWLGRDHSVIPKRKQGRKKSR